MARKKKAVETQLTDVEKLELELSAITDPRAMLRAMFDNSEFIGNDPFYRDLDRIIWKHAGRVLDQTAPKGDSQ